MPGARPRARTDDRPGPPWMRLGCLLVVGQLLIVGLLVARSVTAVPPAPAVGHLAGAVAPTQAVPSTPLAPATTVPAVSGVPATTPPTPTPGTTPPTPASPPSRPQAAASHGIIPPAEPPANIAPDPDFLHSCSGAHYDDSLACVSATVAAITHARSAESLGPFTLPTNWGQLTPAEQIFVATNLERTARGLPALAAMARALDQAAAQGADAGSDPSPPHGFPASQWGSNWAGAVGNPLEALYFWMYDDGPGSANIDCSSSDHSGCWGHRQNVLMSLPCHQCVMGTAWAPTSFKDDPSLAELLVEATTSTTADFTWQQESAYIR